MCIQLVFLSSSTGDTKLQFYTDCLIPTYGEAEVIEAEKLCVLTLYSLHTEAERGGQKDLFVNIFKYGPTPLLVYSQ